MAYRHTSLIGCLLMLVACFEPLDIEIEQPENYVTTVQTWRLDSRERLVESVDLLTKTTHEYLDGRVARTTWQHVWNQAHPLWLEAALLEIDTSYENIDAWPIAPGFLDSLDDYPETGIINDDSLDISSEVLRHQHQNLRQQRTVHHQPAVPLCIPGIIQIVVDTMSVESQR